MTWKNSNSVSFFWAGSRNVFGVTDSAMPVGAASSSVMVMESPVTVMPAAFPDWVAAPVIEIVSRPS